MFGCDRMDDFVDKLHLRVCLRLELGKEEIDAMKSRLSCGQFDNFAFELDDFLTEKGCGRGNGVGQ